MAVVINSVERFPVRSIANTIKEILGGASNASAHLNPPASVVVVTFRVRVAASVNYPVPCFIDARAIKTVLSVGVTVEFCGFTAAGLWAFSVDLIARHSQGVAAVALAAPHDIRAVSQVGFF